MESRDAAETYRYLFGLWQAASPDQRPILEMAMDAVQCEIAHGPADPRWHEFLRTMPAAYHEFWSQYDHLLPRTN